MGLSRILSDQESQFSYTQNSSLASVNAVQDGKRSIDAGDEEQISLRNEVVDIAGGFV
jgi:hypothetical protein